jgi:hypothetical protein
MDIQLLEKKLAINEHGLEEALREHPTLFYHVASETALSMSRRDEAKQSLEETVAAVMMDIRREAERRDEKVTDKSVEAECKSDATVRKANKFYLDAKLGADKWSALRDAYVQRSHALSKLVELYLNQYYASTQSDRVGSDTFRTMEAQRIKQGVAEKRRRVQVE